MRNRLSRAEFVEATECCPVIPEIRNEEWLRALDKSESKIVYILYGDICTIPNIVKEVKSKGRLAFVHMDLIEGLSSKTISVDFIKQFTEADGIISTKPTLIKRANELHLFTVQRFFMNDGITYANIVRHVKQCEPDVVELMPAGLNKVIAWLVEEIHRPVLASGLTQDKEDVILALNAGALAVSTTNIKLWNV